MNNTVCQNLKHIRIRKGWSQSFVAGMTGISIRSISRMENGCSVSKNTIKKLCNLYKVDVESLYNPSKPAKEMTVDLLSEDVLAGILQRNSLLPDLQREVVLQFTYKVGKTAVMSRDDIQAILSDAITDKKNYNLSDIITACMAVNEKTIRNITDIAVA